MVTVTATGRHRRVEVMSVNNEVVERLHVSPPGFHIIDAVLLLRHDIPKPVLQILLNRTEDKPDHLVGIAGLNGLLCPGNDGTIIQSRRSQPGKRGAFPGPVQSHDGLKEPVIRKVRTSLPFACTLIVRSNARLISSSAPFSTQTRT